MQCCLSYTGNDDLQHCTEASTLSITPPMRVPVMTINSILNMGNTIGTTNGAGITHSFKAYPVMVCVVPFLVFSVQYLSSGVVHVSRWCRLE